MKAVKLQEEPAELLVESKQPEKPYGLSFDRIHEQFPIGPNPLPELWHREFRWFPTRQLRDEAYHQCRHMCRAGVARNVKKEGPSRWDEFWNGIKS